MSIPELFIRRPVATTLVMVGILMFGIIGYEALPVSDLPNVDYPTIQVQASLPGANPYTMGAAVALPLEKQFSTIAGLDSMVSQNTLGNTRIVLQFNLKRSLDGAAQDVQNAISQASRLLPQNMPAPPAIRKVNTALNDGNVNIPAGVLWGPQRTVTLQATGQLYKAADYAKLSVAYRNGSPVRLADLGRVVDSVENPYNASWYYDANSPKGVRAIQLAISKQPGTNV